MAARLKSMPTSPLSVVIQHFLADFGPDGGGRTDGELLARFLSSRDEDALAALVRRHAPMVWGVCRRLLNHHDAEDAFQATFLVLVRKAADVPGQVVANWLYGVARQTAVRLRATAAKRGRRERQVVNMPEPTVAEVRDADLQTVLDEELSRLPDHYRGVIVLCDLEGMTRKQAARQLGIAEGSVASRLARARVMLAKRLTQRGVVFSGGSVAAVLLAGSASATAPPTLVASTIKAASLLAAGQAAGFVSVEVAALTEGVVKAMFVTKIKAALVVVLILGFVATGATIFASRTAAGQDDEKPTAGKPMEPAAKKVQEEQKEPVPAAKKVQEKQKEAFTAWGEEVAGLHLQAGLGLRPGERRVYHYGETVTLVVRVRNVGKEGVNFQYLKKFFVENQPIVTDADGKTIPQSHPAALGFHVPEEVSLAPGKEIELASLQYTLTPSSERGKDLPLYVGTGKVSLQYKRLIGNTSAGRIKVDPDLLKLATGELELEIKPAPAEKK
jgi:RNA polymerase sigma factor (sigma-70 family)